MPDVYVPGEHYCEPPNVCFGFRGPDRPLGAIWRCDQCSAHWLVIRDGLRHAWERVRWWHFTARRRIRKAVDHA